MTTERQPTSPTHPSAPVRPFLGRGTLLPLALGCSVPLGATILDIFGQGLPFSLASIIMVQSARPLHWLLDLIPLVLLFFVVSGRQPAIPIRIAALLHTLTEKWFGTSASHDEPKASPSVPVSLPSGILLAEDNPVNQKLISRLLLKLGYDVKVVGTGDEAVESLAHASYALVFMDCQMPGMDGFQATAEIRLMEKRQGRHTPIIALTAHVAAGDKERCLAAGMDDYLGKPITQHALRAMLAKWGCTPPLDPSLRPLGQEISL
ncbi:MAG: response regulator [Deltaproteobacteria bacterium]|nr:response regulator [Deltaproteobacteria bacterium]